MHPFLARFSDMPAAGIAIVRAFGPRTVIPDKQKSLKIPSIYATLVGQFWLLDHRRDRQEQGLASRLAAGDSAGRGQDTGVCWLPWGPAAFDLAEKEDRPILLSISAVWCYWCHVMDADTYSDGEVARFINNHFVPVKVDNDHRPDINARYNVGGWPTTAFLTPHGGYIAGATYLPSDQLLAMLLEVRRAYQEDKASLYDQAAQLQRQRQEFANRAAAGPEPEHRLVDLIARRMAGAYDPRNGGFGEQPKFPSAPILRFLLHRYRTTGEAFYRAMLEKSLDAMAAGELRDCVEGGFFRYCAQADWTEVQREKLLEDNVHLARVYLDAGLLLGRKDYRSIAGQTIDYLLKVLYHQPAGGFRGSQGAHSDYFALPAASRLAAAAPDPDPYAYAGWTGQAVSLLLEASWKLPRPWLAQTAAGILDSCHAMAASGRLPHAFRQAGMPSPQLTQPGDLFCDWAALLNALMDAGNYCPERPDFLAHAVSVAEQMEKRFYDSVRGGFFDVEADPEAKGYLRTREKALPDNSLAAEALLKLHYATRDNRYRRWAERTLSAFVEANRDHGEHAAAYAAVVDQYLHPPVEITIEGQLTGAETRAMVAAAMAIDYPNVLIKPAAALPATPTSAHVCIDGVCFPPVQEPSALAVAVAAALADPEPGPVGNVFEAFTGF